MAGKILIVLLVVLLFLVASCGCAPDRELRHLTTCANGEITNKPGGCPLITPFCQCSEFCQ